MTRKAAFVLATLFVILLLVAARVSGASWHQIVWGGLGFFASALAASFVHWLVTGGPLNLERRPQRDADRTE